MVTELLKFQEFSIDRLYEVLKLRVDVFVVEQNCAYPELDAFDQYAMHLLFIEEGEVIAYSRIFPPGEMYEECAIGRVIVKQKARGKGLAKQLMQKSIDEADRLWDVDKIKICAQSRLENFYSSLGFECTSAEFLEDGIPHIYMIRKKHSN